MATTPILTGPHAGRVAAWAADYVIQPLTSGHYAIYRRDADGYRLAEMATESHLVVAGEPRTMT